MENNKPIHKSAPKVTLKTIRRAAMKEFKKMAVVNFNKTADKLFHEEILPVAEEKNRKDSRKEGSEIMENNIEIAKNEPKVAFKTMRQAAMRDFKKKATVKFNEAADKVFRKEILPVVRAKNKKDLKKAQEVMLSIRNTLDLLENMDEDLAGATAELNGVQQAADVIEKYTGKKKSEHEALLETQEQLEKNLKTLKEL